MSRPSPRTLRWLPGLLGVLLAVGVFVAALRFSDAKEFAELARRAEPGWLVVAIVLQAGTYLAAGQVFRGVVHAAGHAMGLGAATRLSLTKLCVDQAIPSAGLSGATFVANELEQRGIPRPVVAAGIVVDLASYHAAHMLSLAIALIIAAVLADVDAVVLLVALVFFALGTGFSLLVLAVTGGRRNLVPRRLRRLGPLRIAIDFVSDADPRLARDPRRLLRASTCQLAVVLFDATTVWVLVRSLGDHASPSGVFASYMISSLLQTVGIVPGGLGAFEAASVVTLRIVGVATPVALAATFLFRGLSFWLPMLPGLWFSRHVVRRAGQAGRAPGRRTDRRKD